jgi:hypothetical protein
MFIKNVLTLSFSKATGMRHAIKFLLLASILAGLTVACATTTSETLNKPVDKNAVAQASNVLPQQEPAAISPQTHLPGRNFGDIYGAVDPGASQRADPPSFIYWSNGQMVVRRSGFGPGHDFGSIYGTVDPGASLNTDPVDVSVPARGPGHDYGAIYGAIYGTVDPGSNLPADPIDISLPAHRPGHDFGAIYGDVDPGGNQHVSPQP